MPIKIDKDKSYTLKFLNGTTDYKEIIVGGNHLQACNFMQVIMDSENNSSNIIRIDGLTITLKNNPDLTFDGLQVVFEFISHKKLAIKPGEMQFYLTVFLRTALHLKANNLLIEFTSNIKKQYQLSAEELILADYPYPLIYDLYQNRPSLLLSTFLRLSDRRELIAPLGFSASLLAKAGFTAEELKCAEFKASELKKAMYSCLQLKNAGYTLNDLVTGGFSASELREANFSASQLIDKGFTPYELIFARFTCDELTTAGIDCNHIEFAAALKSKGADAYLLKNAGFNAKVLKELGSNARELKEAGFSAKELKEAGFIARELKDAGFNARELKDIGFNAWELKRVDFNTRELKEVGFNARELKDAGFNARELRNAGFWAIWLKEAGFSARELKEAGFNPWELKEAGFNTRELKEAGFNARELRNAGFWAIWLKEAGFSARELKEAGLSARELKEAGFNARELSNAGFNLKKLREAGFNARELRNAGFWAIWLKEAGFNLKELKDAGYNAVELFDADYNQEELSTVMNACDAARQLINHGTEIWELLAKGFNFTQIEFKNYNQFIRTVFSYPDSKSIIFNQLLKKPLYFKKIISSMDSFLFTANSFPDAIYSHRLLCHILKDGELLYLAKNTEDLSRLVKFFPQYAGIILKVILSSPQNFNHFLKTDEELITFQTIFSEVKDEVENIKLLKMNDSVAKLRKSIKVNAAHDKLRRADRHHFFNHTKTHPEEGTYSGNMGLQGLPEDLANKVSSFIA